MNYQQLADLGIVIERGALGDTGHFPDDAGKEERRPGSPPGSGASVERERLNKKKSGRRKVNGMGKWGVM